MMRLNYHLGRGLVIRKMLPQSLISFKTAQNIFKHFFCQIRLNGNWNLEQLKQRTVLKLTGEKCSEFLQGLITNDINLLSNQKALYAMFLNTKGRILYDTIIYNADNNSFFIECDVNSVKELSRHLNMFKVRKKIDISNGSHNVWSVFKTRNEEEHDFKLELGEKCLICPDPRIAELGYRIIVPEDASISKIINNPSKCYHSYRYNLGIAEGVEEIPIGKCFPLEMNCDYLSGVSFNKGCYIGQEVTARTHHTGVVRKRLMPLIFLNPPEKVSFDDPIVDPNSQKPSAIGKLKGIFGNLGLGLMRVSETLASTSLKIGDNDIKCIRPTWWPATSEEFTLKKNL